MGDLQRSTSRCATSQIFFSIVWNFRVLRLRFPHNYIIFAFETKSLYNYDLYNKKRARPGILSWHRLHRSLKEAKSLDSYQHRTLGTSRRHGVHQHTTPFHSTAGEATISLPRRAFLALWGSTSKTHFVILSFVILSKLSKNRQKQNKNNKILIYYILYIIYNILFNIMLFALSVSTP